VPRATMEYLAQHSNLRPRLGFPVSRPPTSGPEEPLQFFEHGVVTIRDGKVEVWLKPDPRTSYPARRQLRLTQAVTISMATVPAEPPSRPMWL